MRLLLVSLAATWAVVTGRTATLWSDDRQLLHGWIVPVLAAFLLAERRATAPSPSPAGRAFTPWAVFGVGIAGMTIARLWLEAFPTWPAMHWLLMLFAGLVSYACLASAGGPRWARHFLFPFAFMLTALPWPTGVRVTFDHAVSPAIAAISAFVINEFVAPAVQRGNLVEIAQGTLGIAEACSGVRSLESAVMIALFAGEIFRLGTARRLALLLGSVALALLGNVIRTIMLAGIAVTQGLSAVDRWHDPIGYAILVLTLPAMLMLGHAWRHQDGDKAPPNVAADEAARPGHGVRPARICVVCAAAMLFIELAPRWWYTSEPGSPLASRLTLLGVPGRADGGTPTRISPEAQAMLACDRAEGATWRAADGSPRAGYVLEWVHGHEARFRLALHGPAICLPLAGMRLVQPLPEVRVGVGERELTFEGWEFESRGQSFLVYSCALDVERLTPLASPPRDAREWLRWRWETLAARRRDNHVLVVTVALGNPPGETAARRAALASELRAMTATGQRAAGDSKDARR